MPQKSGPLANQNFTDDAWRVLFGDEPGIVGDIDGSSYDLTLPTSSDVALLGSTTQLSASRVGGFAHYIPQGEAESVTIPPSINASAGRTDLIVARYDPSFNTEPGPVRLVRIPGVEGSTSHPSYNGAPPGLEDMPLWAVTRKSGQSLNQAVPRDLRVRCSRKLNVREGNSMPSPVPIGTLVERGGSLWERGFDSSGAVAWKQLVEPPSYNTGGHFMTSGSAASGSTYNYSIGGLEPPKIIRDGLTRSITIMMRTNDWNNIASPSVTGNIPDQIMWKLNNPADFPAWDINFTVRYRYVEDGGSSVAYGFGVLTSNGRALFTNLTPGVPFRPSNIAGRWDVQMSMSWSVAP